ncbi:putative manganese-transporting ATPase PDR2 [Camellia lanceoleosa]|uniref:Manganese-transporting ATPase PDR2 n=1 Tax=Camellia lanceoleosa TaxID=1840588 RepID=A0ACC0IVK0_9ERIC|nr:putative manganese-transporting ATPase PDR2 [Camellia lanceoleosa]
MAAAPASGCANDACSIYLARKIRTIPLLPLFSLMKTEARQPQKKHFFSSKHGQTVSIDRAKTACKNGPSSKQDYAQPSLLCGSLVFESTMAKSWLKTLTELRRVRVDGQTVMVHRCGKWVKLSGMDLLPGDVVSIGRSTGENGEDKSVPADMLILAGSAIVNEAILTGESTPQWKVSIVGRGVEDKLSIRRDKTHVLFGGTKILQHTSDKSFLMKTPDGGCLAVVLRTGFETSQGKLMRTILFSTERETANSWESGLFILFLVVFAVIAVGYLLKKGLEDPTRSKYKLFLSCSLIITSMIPPELPMELSIAVNTSLIALAQRGIFCTEPFRIPFAGKMETHSTSIALRHGSDLTTSIKSMLSIFSPGAKKTVSMLLELAQIVAQEKALLEELFEHFRVLSTLEIQERSLKCTIIQMKLWKQQQQKQHYQPEIVS